MGVISFVCLNPKGLWGQPAWDLAAGEEVEMGVHAPCSFIRERRVSCHGSLVAYVSVLEQDFEPCGRPRRWRIDDAQTVQRHSFRKFYRLLSKGRNDSESVNGIWQALGRSDGWQAHPEARGNGFLLTGIGCSNCKAGEGEMDIPRIRESG